MLIINLILFIIACSVLVKSSSLMVRSLSKISHHLRINEFAIGFIIMAVSTSIPELFVGVTSAIEKNPALAIGTVIGSNILDLTIIIGIVALLSRGVKIRSKIIKKDILYMMAIVLLPVFLMVDREISRMDGLILLGVFVVYIWQLTRQERKFKRTVDHVKSREAMFYALIALVGVIILLISASFVVKFATLLSIDLVLPPIFIGLFVISAGTSLPELIFETKAVISRHEELALGDLIGSVITNSTLVLGITALIYPISADLFLFFTSAIFMVLIAFIFMTFAESDKGVSWREGVALIFLYIFFVIIESYIKMITG